MKERERSKSGKNKNGGVRAGAQKVKAKLLKSYYGNPTKDMKLIAITGTTGKVIVAHYIHEILRASGEQVAVLASDKPFKMSVLHKFLSDAWKAGANYVASLKAQVKAHEDIIEIGAQKSGNISVNSCAKSDVFFNTDASFLDGEKQFFKNIFLRDERADNAFTEPHTRKSQYPRKPGADDRFDLREKRLLFIHYKRDDR